VEPFSYSQLARLPPFRRLWLGDLASQSSDRMAFVAITVLAYTGSESALGLSLVIGAYFFPAVVLGIAGGIAADRFPRRTMMVAADGVRVAIALAMAALGAGVWLLPMVLAFSSLTQLFYPARQAAIPALVPARALLPANAAISVNLILGFAIGPAVGGLLVAYAGASTALFAAAGVMALGVGLIASIPDAGIRTRAATPGASVGATLRDGLASVRGHAVLWQGLALIGFVMFAVGGGAVGLVVLGDRRLGLGDGGFSILLSALGVGTLIGALVIGGGSPGAGKGRFVTVAPALAGALLFFLPLSDSLWLSLAVMVMLGIACAMVIVPFTTMLQERMGDHVMGTSFGVLNMALTTPMVVGVVVAGPILDDLGLRQLFAILGVLLLVVSVIWLALSDLWRSG
jgi:MFS family permease